MAAAAQQDIKTESFGLSRFDDVEAGRPILDSEDEEELCKEFPDVSLVLGDSLDQGQGTLFITSRRVIWLASPDHKQGYAAGFPSINMHAIYSTAQRPCIYMQMEPSTPDLEEDEPEEADDDEKTPEIMLVPSDASTLEDMFKALCDSAALNPDPGQEEDEEDAEFFYDEEEVLAGADPAERAAMLDHYDSLLHMPRADDLDELLAEDPERFEDPDELGEEEEEGGDAANHAPHATRPQHPTHPEQ